MGCTASRLEDEEAVKMCRDRREFIKQAVEQRNRFASGHVAYVESLRRVSMALQRFVAGDDCNELFLIAPEIIGIPYKSFPPKPPSYEKRTIHVAKYLRSGPNPSVSVEEWPQPAETIRIESHYPMDNYGGEERFFGTQPSPTRASSYYTPYDRPSYPPPSTQESQWDFFWNPFSSLDSYTYPYPRSSYDRVAASDDELARLQRVREEEGIPELEEEDDECQEHGIKHDDDEEEEEEEEVECEHFKDHRWPPDEKPSDQGPSNANSKANAKQEAKEFQSKGVQCADTSEPRNAVEVDIKAEKKEMVRNKVRNAQETPGFTVYLNRRPASLVEAMKEIDGQFSRICDAAQEVSVMLEASRAHYTTSSDLSVKMLNPMALLRSTSSRSSSSRFLLASSGSREDGYESSSCYSSEDSCMTSGSHQSTLDRLYAWEKKLYKEVKAGEKLRLEYEKRLKQLRSQDVNGEEPSSLDKTRAALRSLQTRLKVSIHTVQSISRRIEVLRDEELHPQLMELMQGLSRMWRTMADCHRIQKRTIDDAKLLFLHHPAAAAAVATAVALGPPDATTPPPAAVALESELRAWREALEAWLSAQRAYARALAAWARRCLGGGARAHAAPPLAFVACMEWVHAVDAVTEARVMDGLDFFVAGVASVCGGAAAGMEGMAGRVLCAGMAAVTGAMAEFALASAESYKEASARVVARVPERGKEEERVAQP